MTTEQMDWLDDERAGRHAPRVILNPDEPAPDLDPEQHFGHEEEHTHYTREARDQCAAGDHKYAKLLDDAAEREKIKATIDRPQGTTADWYAEGDVMATSLMTGETTMAEEPIENRLRRAWLNGFRDGVERAAYATTESTGRWDY
jgi:hypothetical protein